MQVSAEIRWFWRAALPSGLEDWFRKADHHSCPAGGGRSRDDEYLRDPGQKELGIKRRGGKKGVEVKGLVAIAESALAAGTFAGPIEIWTKWTTEALELDANTVIKTTKRRWLRKFDTTGPSPLEIELDAAEKPTDNRSLPSRGCNVELTEVTLPSGIWWTLGLEAFGTIHTVEADLRTVAATLAARFQLGLGNARLASYPAWLSEHAGVKAES
jgi:hypothetical protein